MRTVRCEQYVPLLSHKLMICHPSSSLPWPFSRIDWCPVYGNHIPLFPFPLSYSSPLALALLMVPNDTGTGIRA
ncbi:hypothetical protein PILCRDRAFT_384584 [Piloderma croceum F 1598]|uniref:Uncharacterized protein n=1 Tax=Piloderma croceum (strain F 1598) TaxID=765440 RepID=A0A0C3FXY3_PILCF|nr:hypothetical protein PILCRDRAFT_384584 [Piloderma croceum F 1598]